MNDDPTLHAAAFSETSGRLKALGPRADTGSLPPFGARVTRCAPIDGIPMLRACLSDLDGNGWQIRHRPGRLFDDVFSTAEAVP